MRVFYVAEKYIKINFGGKKRKQQGFSSIVKRKLL